MYRLGPAAGVRCSSDVRCADAERCDRNPTEPLGGGKRLGHRRGCRDRGHIRAQRGRSGRLAERRLPARGAPRLRLLGARARPDHLAAQCRRVQLLPPAADRTLHHRRQPQLGGAGGVHHRRRGGEHDGRARPQPGARIRTRPGPRPTWRQPSRETCWPSRTPAAAWPPPPDTWPTRWLCPRPRSSWANSRGMTASVRSPCATARASRSPPCSCPPRCRPDVSERLRSQVVPALQAIVAIALRRDAVQAEAVETEALRRSDDVKTALLRAVSHDLRTPLTAIVAAGHALGTDSLDRRGAGELSAGRGRGRTAALGAGREAARPLDAFRPGGPSLAATGSRSRTCSSPPASR